MKFQNSKIVFYITVDEKELTVLIGAKSSRIHKFNKTSDGKYVIFVDGSYGIDFGYDTETIASVNPENEDIIELEHTIMTRLKDYYNLKADRDYELFFANVETSVTIDKIDTFADEYIVKRQKYALNKLTHSDIMALGIEDLHVRHMLTGE